MNSILPVVQERCPDETEAAPFRWPEEGRVWVKDPRREAPGLDGLLTWAFKLGASRIAFQTGHPVWIRVHGRNHRATDVPLTEVEMGQIANHLYGADERRACRAARISMFLRDCAQPLAAAAVPPQRHLDPVQPACGRQHRPAPDRGPAALAGAVGGVPGSWRPSGRSGAW